MNYRVYFIGEDPYTNKVKIGKTNNVKNRIRTLQTGNPYKLRIIGTISCQDEKTMSELEKRLHNELKDKRLVGEWVNVTMDEVVVLHARENYSAIKIGRLHVLFEKLLQKISEIPIAASIVTGYLCNTVP